MKNAFFNQRSILNSQCGEPFLVKESVNKWYIKMYLPKAGGKKRPDKKFTGNLNNNMFIKKVKGKYIEIAKTERVKYAEYYLGQIKNKLDTEIFNLETREFEKANKADYGVLHFLPDFCKDKTNIITAGTLEDYEKVFNSFEKYLEATGNKDITLANIDKIFISGYLNEHLLSKGVAKSTRDYHLGVLKIYFNYLTDIKEIIPKSPLKALKKINKADSDKHKPFTPDEFKKILSHTKNYSPVMHLLLVMQYYTLSRPTELLRLRKADIDLTNRKIFFSSDVIKTDRKKIYHLDDITYKLLCDLIPDWNNIPDNYYFLGNTGKPQSRGTKTELQYFGEFETDIQIFQNKFYYLKEKLKLHPDHTLYGTKHTGAIRLIEMEVQPAKIMLLTGHKDFAMFQIYIRELENMMDTSIKRTDNILESV